ncbi:tobamovirus multiplication 2A-like [Olea europaea subsp. europaea]|uniref:Tobamovirus multiplication 2A-like n=1 Tax=Olea europaea subsp. europaea TaxID=158383 RepID=A0A8S0UED8_OLEEU|nr:tobamovirus multiplication 2A-like [Olea europaea subsp. europaea]
MACKGFLECLLKLVNFLLALVGLAMVGYGIYLFVEYKNSSSFIVHSSGELLQLGRPMLMAVSLDSISDKLPKAWFIYLFIGIGVVLFVISCCGCIGATLRNGCCLTCYSIFVILLILVELGCAAFIFFDKSWKEEIPTDKTRSFDMIYEFMDKHWKIIRWVALGAVILEKVQNDKPGSHCSTGKLILQPVSPERMRKKYGLDTSEFTYNPSESHRYQQAAAQPSEERSRCIIM